MYDSTKSQVYAGWVTESEPTYGAFRVNAVAATQTATTGQTILYAGVPVNAFFHQGWTFVSMSYLQ